MQLTSLMLDEEGWAELHRAYAEDATSKYLSVRMTDVYAEYNGTFEGSNDTRRTIEAWRGKVFSPVKRGGKMALFTLATAVRLVDVEMSAATSLVLVIPKGAAVQVSRNEAPTAGEQEGVEEWAFSDMRSDIMWWAHQAKWPHAKRVATCDRVLGVAWWPEVRASAAISRRRAACACRT